LWFVSIKKNEFFLCVNCSLDNSEWMRNGDYIPSRLEAQHDAANMLCGTKTQSNPESTVGILTMAGKG
jgi:26S proteasome regulatory subunit N10